MARKIWFILFNVLLIGLALLLVFYLFFEKEFQKLFALDENGQSVESVEQSFSLTIAGDYNLNDKDPFSLEPATRALTTIIYEPLVRRDFDFSLKPALALSWGQLDDKTWIFKLRPDVKYHDGSLFDADDVLINFNALKSSSSDIANLLRHVEKIEKTSSHEVKVTLKDVDPLFLMRISYFLQPSNGLGTGFLKVDKKEADEFHLAQFTDYWGEKTALEAVSIMNVNDPYQRVELLNAGKVDLVNNIPKSSLAEIARSNFDYLTVPKLEIGFLLFNGKSKELSRKTKRMKNILDYAVNRNSLLSGIDDNFTPIYQFIPRGIIGVSSDVEFPEMDIYEGKKIIKETFGEEPKELVIHYLPGLNYIAESLQSDLSALGLGILIQELDWQDMETSLREGKADLYLLMWKFDMPDNSEFLRRFVLDNSLYNDQDAKDLISAAIREQDFFQRSQKLQHVMQLVVEENPLGFPLFETNTTYVFKNSLQVRPNLDGGLNLQSIKLKAE